MGSLLALAVTHTSPPSAAAAAYSPSPAAPTLPSSRTRPQQQPHPTSRAHAAWRPLSVLVTTPALEIDAWCNEKPLTLWALQRVRQQGLHFKILSRLLLLQPHKQQRPLASHIRHDTSRAVRVPEFVYAPCTCGIHGRVFAHMYTLVCVYTSVYTHTHDHARDDDGQCVLFGIHLRPFGIKLLNSCSDYNAVFTQYSSTTF
jgi:hypothetical protein